VDPHDRDAAVALPLFGITGMCIPTAGGVTADVGRIGLTGELGYELVVPAGHHLALYEALLAAGEPHGLRLYGDLAFDVLRLERGYGIWAAEFRRDVTPAECGLDRFVAFDKGEFIGRGAALVERETGPARRLVLLQVDAADADAGSDDPVRLDGRLVGEVTSGAYGHHVAMSLALAYVERGVADARPELTVEVMGEPRPARILPEPPYDPSGERMRTG
jgi:dimethylglycine dehydrogenase